MGGPDKVADAVNLAKFDGDRLLDPDKGGISTVAFRVVCSR